MIVTVETPRAPKDLIDYYNAGEGLYWAASNLVWSNEPKFAPGSKAERTLADFCTYSVGRKGHFAHSFDDISFSVRDLRLSRFENQKSVGIFTASYIHAPVDYGVTTQTKRRVIIEKGIPIIDLAIPPVTFPDSRSRVTPQMVTQSLELVAEYMKRQVVAHQAEYVVGLASPRMAAIAHDRWGFGVITHPFPGEIYELFSRAIENQQQGSMATRLQDLLRLQDEVVVYKPADAFLKEHRASRSSSKSRT